DSASSFDRCQAQEALERRGQEGLTAVAAALKKGRLGVRGRLHAVWILAKVEGPAATERLFALAKSDAEPRVQAQAIRALADLPGTDPFRASVLRAVAGRYDAQLVDGLLDRLRRETDAARRRAYADALMRVYKKPAAWTYWGFRPPPRPANSVAWERTAGIEE